jgi:phosphoglycolate phosphatase-like HAD superfamily hydrolase
MPQSLKAQVVIFDVEGTLIDCATQMIDCWEDTFTKAGHRISRDELQLYSGMDGDEMLQALMPGLSATTRKALIEEHGRTYRRDFLEKAGGIEGAHETVAWLHAKGHAIALATTCKNDELKKYDRMVGVLQYCKAVCCGSQVKRGKPHPDLFAHVLKEMRVRAADAIAIGDTPYDALAAKAVGVHAIGVTTGGFSPADLRKSGCIAVVDSVAQLSDLDWRSGIPSARGA